MAALLLGGDRALTLPTDHEILEEERVLAILAAHLPLQFLLDALEEFLTDERFMLGLIELALPEELPAAVEGVAENIVDDGLPDPLTVLRLPTLGGECGTEGEGRMLAGVVELEGTADEVGLCALAVDHPDFLLLLADALVPAPVIAWIPALLGFLCEPFLHFLREIIGVVAREHDIDIPLELFTGFGIFVDDEALLHEVDLSLLIFVEPLIHIDGIA